MATTKIAPAPLTRDLSAIAREIADEYESRGKPIYFGAVPYVHALSTLHTRSLSGRYYEDPASEVVIYLLSNLSYWRGEVAARVKNELAAALADHKVNMRGAV